MIPLTLDDVRNIFAIMSFNLLITSMLLNPYYGKISLYIKKNKIRNALMVFIILFFITLIVKIFNQGLF